MLKVVEVTTSMEYKANFRLNTSRYSLPVIPRLLKEIF